MKLSDSLDNVPNENVVTTGDQQTDRQSDQLLELLEWLFATKNHTFYTTLPILCCDFTYCMFLARTITSAII